MRAAHLALKQAKTLNGYLSFKHLIDKDRTALHKAEARQFEAIETLEAAALVVANAKCTSANDVLRKISALLEVGISSEALVCVKADAERFLACSS